MPDKPANVVDALAAVALELGGIEKKAARSQLGYAYRGIDAIAAAAQPLLGRHGVVIVPDSTITSRETLTVRNNPWVDVWVDVEWTIHGPGDTSLTARTQGLGRDNADKGYNKALTQAYKQLLLRLLCIGDPAEDADGPDHQTNWTDPAPDPEPDDADRLVEALKAAHPDVRDRIKLFAAGRSLSASSFRDSPEWRDLVASELNDYLA
jgi:hypothetical protein